MTLNVKYNIEIKTTMITDVIKFKYAMLKEVIARPLSSRLDASKICLHAEASLIIFV